MIDHPPPGFTEGPPQAWRSIICMIGPDETLPIFQNHFRFREVSLEEAGRRLDQRENNPLALLAKIP